MITPAQLRQELSEIIALEDAEPVDWGRVEDLCLGLVRALKGNADGLCPSQIYRFIDDFDVRQRDPDYAKMQRSRVREFLSF